MNDYVTFIERKSQIGTKSGFSPLWMPDFLFDFQKSLVEWSLEKGKGALYEDCGLGKTPQQLVWAENVVRKTNKPVLILTPLAVSAQTVREAEKFGIEASRSSDGQPGKNITVTNYERLHYFSPDDYAGVVCDESSILKSFDGATRSAITEFMRRTPYRLLCTATAAPNDYIELGTSSEALGELGYMDMLGRFFKSNDGSLMGGNGARRFAKNPFGGKFRFRGHAEHDFWRWVCSWARAIRRPSDMGFDDAAFQLPALHIHEHIVKCSTPNPDYLFDLPAVGLQEQRKERRRTVEERCQVAARLATHDKPVVCWCHLNDEGDLLAEMIPDSIQVSGSDSDEKKEEVFQAFTGGQLRALVTKPVIGAWGLNWQHCAHQTFFPSHSFEQWYQAIRRSWRFGQKNEVTIDIISSEGEAGVLKNLKRKADAADAMFTKLVELMNDALGINRYNPFTKKQKKPKWL